MTMNHNHNGYQDVNHNGYQDLNHNGYQDVDHNGYQNVNHNGYQDVNHNEDKKSWKILPSKMARATRNYMREWMANLNFKPNPEKDIIAFSVGDPCVYGNIRCPEELTSALVEIVTSGCYNGYAASCGHMDARTALAKYLSHGGVEYEPTDVMMYSGCSAALENCISVLADGEKGHNIVISKPGFSLYRTLAEGIGVRCKFYNLLPHKKWQVDIEDLESQIDSNTAAIVVNNPSNPCGSVYSADHLRAILEVANRHKVPIIADEIYDRIVFPGKEFVSMAALGSDVPLLICGGLGKKFLVPGWRMGWIAIHDPIGAFNNGIRSGLQSLGQKILGSCTLLQGAMTKFLNNVPQTYFDELCNTLHEHANICYKIIKDIPGLNPILPDGAMYMMVEIEKEHFPTFSNTSDFVVKLMEEESVVCIPGECFEMPFYMRIVITPPPEILQEACKRMTEFCARYYQ